MRILLVEDDRMIGGAVSQALKDASYAVDWVIDGKAAIEAADLEAYDLVLRDCQEFRVGAAIVDPKEVPDGTTQSTSHP